KDGRAQSVSRVTGALCPAWWDVCTDSNYHNDPPIINGIRDGKKVHQWFRFSSKSSFSVSNNRIGINAFVVKQVRLPEFDPTAQGEVLDEHEKEWGALNIGRELYIETTAIDQLVRIKGQVPLGGESVARCDGPITLSRFTKNHDPNNELVTGDFEGSI